MVGLGDGVAEIRMMSPGEVVVGLEQCCWSWSYGVV